MAMFEEANTQNLCDMCFLKGSEIGPFSRCKDCCQVMCEQCTTIHARHSSSSTHLVQRVLSSCGKKRNLCLKHSRSVSHFCKSCYSGVCIDCMLSDDHLEHTDDVTDIISGLALIREQLVRTKGQITEKIRNVDLRIHQASLVSNRVTDMKAMLKGDLQTAQEKYNRTQNRIEALERDHRVPVLELLNHLVKTKEDLTRCLLECQETIQQDVDITNKYQDVRENFQRIITKDEEACDTKDGIIAVPEEVEISNHSTANEISGAKLVLNLTNLQNEPLVLPWQVVALDPDCVAVLDGSLKQISRISRSGSLVARYYHQRPKCQHLQSTSEYGKSVYMADEKEIVQIPICFPCTDKMQFYRPNVPQISKILVTDEKQVILSDGQTSGSIYLYNKQDDTAVTLISGLLRPTYLTVVDIPSGVRYVVTEEEGHRVRIYDAEWHLQATIGEKKGSGYGQLSYPCATAATPSGCILVADSHNHRVSLFNTQGKFLHHVLTEENGIQYPVGLAYLHPYVWVTSTVDVSVKCYQIT